MGLKRLNELCKQNITKGNEAHTRRDQNSYHKSTKISDAVMLKELLLQSLSTKKADISTSREVSEEETLKKVVQQCKKHGKAKGFCREVFIGARLDSESNVNEN